MSLDTALNNLVALIEEDDALTAWAQEYGGQRLTTLHGGRHVDSINLDDLPVFVIDMGDASLEPQLGNDWAESELRIRLGFGWLQEDPAEAFEAKKKLFELLPKALMSDPTLSGTMEWIYVEQFVPDGGANIPAHYVNATLLGQLIINAA